MIYMRVLCPDAVIRGCKVVPGARVWRNQSRNRSPCEPSFPLPMLFLFSLPGSPGREVQLGRK